MMTYMRMLSSVVSVWALAALLSAPLLAQTDSREAEFKAAQQAAALAQQTGPANVALRDQATLKLPSGFVFIPQEPAAKLMGLMGNRTGDSFVGLIHGDGDWFVTINFIKEGYIKDDDAKDWNANDLLKSLKEGTEEQNAVRRQQGMTEIDVVGWAEKPAYDATTHRLVWSAIARDKGGAADDDGVNYNTYMLGRDGYVSMNLVTQLKELDAQRPIAQQLLGATEFTSGKRYNDFNASTDHVAEYGLAALVAGAAAKKLGLLAVIGVFLLKAWKLILIGLVAFGGGLAKFFGGRRKNPDTPDQGAAR